MKVSIKKKKTASAVKIDDQNITETDTFGYLGSILRLDGGTNKSRINKVH